MPAICDHCGDIIIEDCECAVCDSDCISVDGKGDVDRPFTFEPILDPDEDNIAECDDYNAGFGAYLPTWISNPPRCNIYASGNQSNLNDTDLVMAFNTERYDTDSMHDTVTDNDLVVFNTAGIYLIEFRAAFAANATGERKASIYKNGVQQIGHAAKKAASASFETGVSVVIQEAFEVDDTIRARTRQDSGGALNVLATRYSPILSVLFLRPLPS